MTRDNSALSAARRAKKDEFYTQLDDIEKEMGNYVEQFKGKSIYCNCDDPYVSNFTRYFGMNFDSLELKRLVTTCFKNDDPKSFSQHDSSRGTGICFEGGGGRLEWRPSLA